MSGYDTYFGLSDETRLPPDEIQRKHLPFSAFEGKIKHGSSDTGKQIIVGIKGCGKSNLRRYLEITAPRGSTILNLDSDHKRFAASANELKGHSGQVKNVLSFLLLNFLIQVVHERTQQKSTKLSQSFAKIKDVALKVAESIPDAIEPIKVGVGPLALSFNVSALLSARASQLIDAGTDSLVKKVTQGLGDQKVYVMIDDAEDVIDGLEKNADVIEGLARSVSDMNFWFEKRIHILLFLKHGIWRYWSDNRREYDKVRDYIQFITWDHDALVQLIARRIAFLKGREPSSVRFLGHELETLWSLEFDIRGKLDELTREFTMRCVNGPRDMIRLCNLAKTRAQDSRISVAHLNEALETYSDDKLDDINGDFSDVYAHFLPFCRTVLEWKKQSFKGTELAERIRRVGTSDDDDVIKASKDQDWYKRLDRGSKVRMFFEVGVVGVAIDNHRVIYSVENPNIPTEELMSSKLCVHPAFLPALNMKQLNALQTSTLRKTGMTRAR